MIRRRFGVNVQLEFKDIHESAIMPVLEYQDGDLNSFFYDVGRNDVYDLFLSEDNQAYMATERYRNLTTETKILWLKYVDFDWQIADFQWPQQ